METEYKIKHCNDNNSFLSLNSCEFKQIKNNRF